MGIDEFNKSFEDKMDKAARATREAAGATQKIFVWMFCLIVPISIGAYLGDALPAWGGPIYGLIAAWLAVVFFGDSRYRWVVSALTFIATCFSWYLGLLVDIH